LNRSPDEGDIAYLNISGVADNFSGQRVCGVDLDVLVHELQNIIAKSALFPKNIGDGGRVAVQI